MKAYDVAAIRKRFSGLTQRAKRGGIVEHARGNFRHPLDVKKVNEQAIAFVLDDFTNRRRVRREHGGAASEGIEQRPA